MIIKIWDLKIDKTNIARINFQGYKVGMGKDQLEMTEFVITVEESMKNKISRQ
jgi:hypothetical protein